MFIFIWTDCILSKQLYYRYNHNDNYNNDNYDYKYYNYNYNHIYNDIVCSNR